MAWFRNQTMFSFQGNGKGQMIQRTVVPVCTLRSVDPTISGLTVANPDLDQQFKRAEIIWSVWQGSMGSICVLLCRIKSRQSSSSSSSSLCTNSTPPQCSCCCCVLFMYSTYSLFFGKWSANIGEKFIKLTKAVYWLGLDFQACKKIFLGSLHEKFEQTNPLSVSCSIKYVSIPNKFLSRMYNFLWELEGFFWFNPSNPNPDPNTADDRKVEGPSQRWSHRSGRYETCFN